MTRLVVNAGSCGYTVSIGVEKDTARKYRLDMVTECKHVRKLGETLTLLDRMDALKPISSNPVYIAAAASLKHAACPIPSAILKALEVEAGLNVPKDVEFKFER